MVQFINLLKQIKFTSKDVESELRKNNNINIGRRDDSGVEKMELPIFLDSFYGFCTANQRIPSQRQFFLSYLSDNPKLKQVYDEAGTDFRWSLSGRLYRAYFSLVRDIHMALLLRELGSFEVVYNTTADSLYKIDIIIRKNELEFGFNLFIDTERSYNWRKVKELRKKLPVNFSTFDIPFSMNGSVNCNNVYLYSDREIRKIIEIIDAKLQAKR